MKISNNQFYNPNRYSKIMDSKRNANLQLKMMHQEKIDSIRRMKLEKIKEIQLCQQLRNSASGAVLTLII